MPIFAWNIPLVSLIFLMRSLVFPILLFPSIPLHWSLRKTFLSLLAFLWNSAFRWIWLSFSPLFCPSLHACPLGISDFLKEISSLSPSIVFLYFFALITEEGFLISPCYSLELCIQMGISFLFSFAFHFFSQLFVRSPQTIILHFFFLEMILVTTSYTISQTSIYSSSSTLSDLIPWIYLSLPLYNCKGFDLGLLFIFFYFEGMRNVDFSSATRDQTCTSFIGSQSLNHWTARELPLAHIYNSCFKVLGC